MYCPGLPCLPSTPTPSLFALDSSLSWIDPQFLVALVLLVAIGAACVAGLLMGLTQSDLGYANAWMNSDLGAAVVQALLVALVTYLVSEPRRGCRAGVRLNDVGAPAQWDWGSWDASRMSNLASVTGGVLPGRKCKPGSL